MDRRKLKAKRQILGSQNKRQKLDFDPRVIPWSLSSFSNVEAEMNNQEPSKSSEIDKGQAQSQKKRKKESQSENEDEDSCFIDKLPPEMLVEILEYLDVKSLFAARLVSRKWNGIARKILGSRNDVQTVFTCEETEDGNLKIQGKTERYGASMKNFIKCFEDSTESPLYTHFSFVHIKTSIFDHADWLKFICDFGQSVKSLKLVYRNRQNFENLMKLAENLRQLLLSQLPKLEELGLQFCGRCRRSRTISHPPQEIQLFPTKAAVQLANLKVVHLDYDWFSEYNGIVSDLLCASVNLQKIELNRDYSYSSIKSLQLLQSLGKLHCLQTVAIRLDAQFLCELKKTSSAPLTLKLKKLDLYINAHEERNICSDAAAFMSHLFESSKDTLTELKMNPLDLLPQLQVPKFSKVTKLWIFVGLQDAGEIQNHVFSKRLDWNETFPRLQYLETQMLWTVCFPHAKNQDQSVFCLPNLKTLEIARSGMTEEDVVRISHECPNLKELTIYLSFGGTTENFPQVATAIWTHLTKLETLNLRIDLDSPTDAFPALDLCFTGFSGEYCSRLNDLIQIEELSKKSGWGCISRSELKAERKNPSILDLKDLKNLKVTLRTSILQAEITTDLSRNNLKVSEKYAFQLIENLIYKIDKNC